MFKLIDSKTHVSEAASHQVCTVTLSERIEPEKEGVSCFGSVNPQLAFPPIHSAVNFSPTLLPTLPHEYPIHRNIFKRGQLQWCETCKTDRPPSLRGDQSNFTCAVWAPWPSHKPRFTTIFLTEFCMLPDLEGMLWKCMSGQAWQGRVTLCLQTSRELRCELGAWRRTLLRSWQVLGQYLGIFLAGK